MISYCSSQTACRSLAEIAWSSEWWFVHSSLCTATMAIPALVEENRIRREAGSPGRGYLCLLPEDEYQVHASPIPAGVARHQGLAGPGAAEADPQEMAEFMFTALRRN
jgi:hypothetical protein